MGGRGVGGHGREAVVVAEGVEVFVRMALRGGGCVGCEVGTGKAILSSGRRRVGQVAHAEAQIDGAIGIDAASLAGLGGWGAVFGFW